VELSHKPPALAVGFLTVSPLLLPLEGALQAIVAPAHPAPLWQMLTIDAAGLCGMQVLFGLFAWYRVTRFRLLDEPAPLVVANQERKREQG
jgi:hypothetical protein